MFLYDLLLSFCISFSVQHALFKNGMNYTLINSIIFAIIVSIVGVFVGGGKINIKLDVVEKMENTPVNTDNVVIDGVPMIQLNEERKFNESEMAVLEANKMVTKDAPKPMVDPATDGGESTINREPVKNDDQTGIKPDLTTSEQIAEMNKGLKVNGQDELANAESIYDFTIIDPKNWIKNPGSGACEMECLTQPVLRTSGGVNIGEFLRVDNFGRKRKDLANPKK